MLGVLAGAAGGTIAVLRRIEPAAICHVVVDASRYDLHVEQAANATTIAATARRMSLPDHAVTIALAAALQESRLQNLAFGDRDSLGLFQQRPSQGWGTRAQLLDPRYASTAFFRELSHVHNWQSMTIADAAQAVQRSAAPLAYSDWEAEARVIAIATTGERPAALTCTFPAAKTPAPTTTSVSGALASVLGAAPLSTTPPPHIGWTAAAWLVAHARELHVSGVTYAHRRWTDRHGWAPPRLDVPSTLDVTVVR